MTESFQSGAPQSGDIPLKLKLDPGDYQCYASVPADDGNHVRVGGMLSLKKSHGPELQLHGNLPAENSTDPMTGVTRSTYPQFRTFPLLHVDLVRGNDVLLIDCTATIWNPGQAIVDAAAALVGQAILNDDDHSPRFANLLIQISGAAAVIAPPPLENVTFPVKREPEVPATWSATERLPRRFTDTDAGGEISAYWYVSFSASDGYAHRVTFSPVIEITLTEPVDLSTLREQWLIPLRSIIGLSTGRAETITYLGVQLATGGTELQVFGTSLSQQPYAPRQNDIFKINATFRTYGHDNATLLTLCRGWQSAIVERHPLIETLGAFLALPGQHPRTRFLLLIQALEGLYGHVNSAELERRSVDHQAMRQRAREAVRLCEGLEPEIQKFIRNNIPNRPASSLERALWSAVRDLPVDLTPRLSNIELVADLCSEQQGVSDWASAFRVVRNGLSHGSRSWPAELLEPAAQLLEVIARAHLMAAIGVGIDPIQRYLTHNA